MTPAQKLDGKLGDTQTDALGAIRRGLNEWPTPRDRYVFKRDIQERAEIRNVAGKHVDYSDIAAEMFEQFGDELSTRISLRAMLGAEAAE
jgi:hypothetical protein